MLRGVRIRLLSRAFLFSVAVTVVAVPGAIDSRGAVSTDGRFGAGPARAAEAAGAQLDPINPYQQTALSFGLRSHWLQPWRAYLETVPASRLRNGLGIVFNVEPRQADETARALAAAGFRRARIEIPWSNVSFDDPPRLKQSGRYRTLLTALRRNGLRPLVLLNANHRSPGPVRRFTIRIAASARAGARTLVLDAASAELVSAGLTGLDSSSPDKAADIMFTSVEGTTVTLSKPLPRDLAASNYTASTLRYEPFRRPADPLFERTLRGWLSYVGLVTREVRAVLGNDYFDVEIWNELSFGSDFLDLNRYYDPDILQGDAAATQEAILRRTVAYLRDPANGVSRVGIGNGFASERPWEAGSTSPVGLTAIDKHPYSSRVRFPQAGRYSGDRPVDALGRVAEERDANGSWHDVFAPRYEAFFPEYYLTGIQSEYIVRDLSPITTDLLGTTHGRSTRPPGGSPPVVWLTEFGLTPADVPGWALSRFKAKMALRAATAWVNKGAAAIYFYAARHGHWALYQPRASGGGEALRAIGRLTAALTGPNRLTRRMRLRLEAISDLHDRRQFDGDGTPAHPPLFDRDVLAFLPFQVAERRVVVPVYVMTRDMLRVQRPTLPPRDPRRFDQRPARFRLTIGGVRHLETTVRATDPLDGKPIPVDVISRKGDRLVVELSLTDSPRLLILG